MPRVVPEPPPVLRALREHHLQGLAVRVRVHRHALSRGCGKLSLANAPCSLIAAALSWLPLPPERVHGRVLPSRLAGSLLQLPAVRAHLPEAVNHALADVPALQGLREGIQ